MKLACLSLCSVLALAAVARADSVAKIPPQPTIPPAVAARIPEPGWLLAGATLDDGRVFVIARVTRTGLVELNREAGHRVDALHWVDRTTLLVLDGDDPKHRLRWFVDGKLDATRTIEVGRADWALPADAGDLVEDPMLATGPRGALWLHRCYQRDEATERCRRAAYLRVDARPFTVTSRKPKGLRDVPHQIMADRPPGDTPLPRLARAPAGYKVKLERVTFTDPDLGTMTVKGFTCTGGGARTRWPLPDVSDVQFELRPDKVQWLSATPPLFYVEGKETNPIGQSYRNRAYFRACEREALDDFRWYGGGLWAQLHSVVDADRSITATYWTLHLDDQELAVVPADGAWFAPAPR